MATIRAYTTIEQSRKLAEILPLESADMYYPWYIEEDGDTIESGHRITTPDIGNFTTHKINKMILPCWSLAALLDVMPKDESVECAITFGYYNGKGEYIEKWLCAFEKEGETTDDFIIETFDGDNPVDACVDMIKRLHELNLL